MRRPVVVFVVLVVASLSVLATKPPARLEVDTVTGGDNPGVQSLGSSESAQPVDVMNWLIDENGNLRVSNQVRDLVLVLLPDYLEYFEPWESEWIDARRFNVVRFDIRFSTYYAHCYYVTRWYPGHEYAQALTELTGSPTTRWDVFGPEIKVRCAPGGDYSWLGPVAIYLRAE